MQKSNTRELVFGVQKLVSFLSQAITLEPGDVIATGTPAGTGAARVPPRWLRVISRAILSRCSRSIQSHPFASE